MRSLAALALLGILPAAPRAGEITITTADDIKRARSISMREAGDQLMVEYVDTGGRAESIRCSDVVEIGLNPPAPPSRPVGVDDVELLTTAGDSIFGRLGDPEEGKVTLVSAALGPTAYPFEQVDQLRFLSNRATWPKRPPAKRDNDAVITTSGDHRQGSIRSIARAGMLLHSMKLGRDVTIALNETAAVFFMSLGARPEAPAGLYSMVILSDGSTLQCSIESLQDGTLTFKDFYGAKRSMTSASIAAIYFRNGRVVYLSDLPAAKVDENPNYIRLATPLPSDLSFPYQRDRSVREKPLRIRGQTFRKGIGVHARSELTWTLDGRYARFQAAIGIDDAATEAAGAAEIGNVTFQVFADGAKIFDSGPVTSREKPRSVAVAIAGRKELTLIVDFGDDRSGQGDLADWALARVIK